jgi:hypothetical protein
MQGAVFRISAPSYCFPLNVYRRERPFPSLGNPFLQVSGQFFQFYPSEHPEKRAFIGYPMGQFQKLF